MIVVAGFTKLIALYMARETLDLQKGQFLILLAEPVVLVLLLLIVLLLTRKYSRGLESVTLIGIAWILIGLIPLTGLCEIVPGYESGYWILLAGTLLITFGITHILAMSEGDS